ncbi:MAG: anti-sigma factor family protein [Desulfobaccales bacterium]
MAPKCPEVQDRLSAWLDGELAPEVAAGVARHVESCARCRRELAELEALEQALGSLPEAALPPGLPEKVRARLPRPRRRAWQSLALAASLVLGILLGSTLGRDFYPLTQETGLESEVASLDAFHDYPRGSMGMVLASYQEDEVNGSGK